MKKLVLFAVAAMALSFASCGNKAADAEAEAKRVADSIAAETAKAQEAAAAAADSAAAAIDTAAQKVEAVIK